ncbi:MAG: hypothetical protein OEZ51_02680 [Nitrospinota bacterium]|nr:hypothetical protein [Nitrospinota bacterium]
MNLMKLLTLLGLILAPSLAIGNPATQSPIAAETHVSQRQVTIGDIVTYSIIVRHDPNIQVSPPDPTPLFEKGFEYVDRGIDEPRKINGQIEETFWFKFRADAVGFYNLKQAPIQFTAPAPDNPSQPLPGILQAPEAVIEVRSVLLLDGEANDIKDIKPIIGAGWDWLKYLNWILLGLAAMGAAGGFLWWLTRREKTDTLSSAPAPDLKPHEMALEELDQLLARQLIESGQFREHYFDLSEIFRRYLEALLSIPAPDWTTEEIGAYVSGQAKLEASVRQTILSLLPATDRVKFAKAPVDMNTARQHVEAVRDFIIATTPKNTSKFQVSSQPAV